MANRWIEGWETHRNSQQLARKYASFTGNISTQAGRVFGTSAVPSSAVAVSPSLGNDDEWYIGFGLFFNTHTASVNSGAQGLYMEDGADEQFHVELFSTNGVGFQVRLYRGATLLVQTTDLSFGVWHYIEIGVVINDTTGTYEIRNNGVTLNSAGSVNTADNGNTGADVFAWRWSSNLGTAVRFDDMYVNDSIGASNNTFLGPQIVEGVEVTANGDQNDWVNDQSGVPDVNNFSQVDDAGTANPVDIGSGGIVRSDTNTDIDLYDLTDLQQITGDVNAVQVGIQAAMDVAGTRTLRSKFRDNGTTNANGPNFVVDSTVFDEFVFNFDQNPVTAAAWDVAGVNAGQWGMEVVS